MENINTERRLFVMVPTMEATELMEKEGFWTNSFPCLEDDRSINYYFIDLNWYNAINYQDYVTSISE